MESNRIVSMSYVEELETQIAQLQKQLKEAHDYIHEANKKIIDQNTQLRAKSDLLERFDVAIEVMFQCGGEVDSFDRKDIMKIVSDYQKLKTKTDKG